MLTSYLGLFAGGLLTFASPCVLPLLPVYVALLGGASAQGDEVVARRRLRRAGLGFAVGLAVVFVVLGMGASALASTLAAHRRGLQIVAGIAMAAFGAKLLGLLRVRALDGDARPFLERVPAPNGFFGGALFGVAFAVGWTPCVGPALGAALTYAATTSASPWRAGAQLAVYAAGLAAPLVAAAFAAPRVLAVARRLRGATPLLQKTTGVVLMGVAALFLLDRVDGRVDDIAPSAQASAEQPCATGEGSACSAGIDGAPPSAEGLAGKPRLVEFVSGHCPVCERMAPVVDATVRRCAAADALLRVRVDDEAGRALASRYGVRVVPTFVSVDAAGLEVERMVGEQSGDRLAEALAEVRGQACTVD